MVGQADVRSVFRCPSNFGASSRRLGLLLDFFLAGSCRFRKACKTVGSKKVALLVLTRPRDFSTVCKLAEAGPESSLLVSFAPSLGHGFRLKARTSNSKHRGSSDTWKAAEQPFLVDKSVMKKQFTVHSTRFHVMPMRSITKVAQTFQRLYDKRFYFVCGPTMDAKLKDCKMTIELVNDWCQRLACICLDAKRPGPSHCQRYPQ